MAQRLEAAAAAIRDGKLVVYPTETVYGLGGDALDPSAITRVFEAKQRSRSNPLSLAVPDQSAAREYLRASEKTRDFMNEFLPGPVTVVGERASSIPDVLTAGRDRVGIRIPDHDMALALLDRVAPITATSANISGHNSIREPTALSEQVRDQVAVILDGGETGGTASTVVDPDRAVIHRRGAHVTEIEAWLAEYE